MTWIWIYLTLDNSFCIQMIMSAVVWRQCGALSSELLNSISYGAPLKQQQLIWAKMDVSNSKSSYFSCSYSYSQVSIISTIYICHCSHIITPFGHLSSTPSDFTSFMHLQRFPQDFQDFHCQMWYNPGHVFPFMSISSCHIYYPYTPSYKTILILFLESPSLSSSHDLLLAQYSSPYLTLSSQHGIRTHNRSHSNICSCSSFLFSSYLIEVNRVQD